MTIFEKDNFKIQTISKLSANGVTSLQISEGLAIERTVDDGESYFVVGFVRFEKDEVKYEDVSFRTFELSSDEFVVFKAFLNVSIDLVRLANR